MNLLTFRLNVVYWNSKHHKRVNVASHSLSYFWTPFSQKNTKAKRKTRHNVGWFFEGVLYFGWPNQPSSGTMGTWFYVADIHVIPEIQLDHYLYWSNVYQQDHLSGCLLKHFIAFLVPRFYFLASAHALLVVNWDDVRGLLGTRVAINFVPRSLVGESPLRDLGTSGVRD